MRFNRLLTIILSLALVGSIIYSIVLSRQSEAAIFTNEAGEITAISGFVFDASRLVEDKTFRLEDPDTGKIFTIKVDDTTHVRMLQSDSSFADVPFLMISYGDNVLVNFSDAGIESAASSIDILDSFLNDQEGL